MSQGGRHQRSCRGDDRRQGPRLQVGGDSGL